MGKSPEIWSLQRARILKQLESIEGRQLVIVRYGPSHDPADEWVYNEADIGAARVVWAREMDTQNDSGLLSYFEDRRVWLLEPDKIPVKLEPYMARDPLPSERSSSDKKMLLPSEANGRPD